ncbi:agmatine deiminase family protein [Aureisphaera galaxeae]|uniref:agmatine deiminase family protein n=1 Tax=Aureisphaera galaxeae TaxID=1538023 RepID=UPI0023507769|nr:agmatine deiminase family protein [Aureisphaera galaxeae]MDC8002766.1 agmatine deiminase family protein [Aureisphaera galaxeae]
MKNNFFTYLLVLTLSFSSLSLIAQEVLPKGFTETERQLIEDYQFSSRFTDPPEGPVRNMAEWEEVEYVVITWEPSFPNILRQIVAAAVEECKVIITTQNETSVANYLSSNGIDLTNVSFLDENWNSIWIRDYFANTIYSDDVGELGLVDWIYNRPRPFDDVMPEAHAAMLGIPFYSTTTAPNDLVNTGGNYMSDGLGNAFASELILEENAAGNPYGVTPKNEAEVDAIMEAYLGITNYIKMTPLPYDVINHIDMHMKLLDEETLLVSRYPDGVADGPQIEENINYVLNNFQSAFGTPYKIKRIDAPPSSGGLYPDNGGYYRNYTNALFINKTVLLPLYRPEVDGPAIAQWEEMLPGYNIVGIDVDNPGENLISLVGAIHCITHTIGVENPLWIVHQPVTEAAGGSSVQLDAMIKHNSGISSASVYWREEGQSSYTEVPMSLDSGDNWTVNLTVPNDNVVLEYYIEAEAVSGKVQVRPIVAPEGYWQMEVGQLSVDEFAENNISLPYPNPTQGELNFNLNQIQGNVTMTMTNMLGQQLMQQQIQNANGVVSLQLNDAWNGILLVTFEGDFGKITRKVLKH